MAGNTTPTATIDTISNATSVTLTSVTSGFDANTANQVIQFESKFSAGLDPGKAYVKGYEYESLVTKFVTVDKGRDTASVDGYGTSTAIGNKLNIKNANGFFDIAKHTIIDIHSVNSASQNTSGTAATGQTYGTEFETFLSQTKIGTARIRDIDFLQDSGSTTNTSHFHSDYVIYLYDIRTSNNKTGTVGEANSSLTTIQIGKSTAYSNSTDGTTANLVFNTLAKIGDAYNGATITITTPVLNKVIGEDLDTIQLEDSQSHGGNNGILILEEQGTANGVSNVTDTRVVTGYTGNVTGAFANF